MKEKYSHIVANINKPTIISNCRLLYTIKGDTGCRTDYDILRANYDYQQLLTDIGNCNK